MKLIVEENAKDVAEWCAKYVMKRIKSANTSPENYFVLGLPTGQSLFIWIREIVCIVGIFYLTRQKNYVYFHGQLFIALDTLPKANL